MTFGPTVRHVGEHWQHRQFVIVIPKKQWVTPEEDEAKPDNDQSGPECPKRILPLINTDFHGSEKEIRV